MITNKSAQVILINKNGLVLGVSRKDDHNDFGLPGGKMDPEDGDDPKVTAIRETKEETGLDITNLRLIFAIHKDGFMGYTYLADYSGKIEHDEPHVVKWQPMEVMVNGRFGRYNQLVAESLNDMNIKYQYHVDMNALTLDVTQIIDGHYNGEVKLDFIRKEWGYNHYNIYFVDDNGELEETFGFDKSLDKKLDIVSKKYGVKVKLSSEYYCK
jgi:ADP-ribose pyrophosphatase YjhB (NUDIX family)